MFMMIGLWQQLGVFSDTAMGLLGFDKVRLKVTFAASSWAGWHMLARSQLK